ANPAVFGPTPSNCGAFGAPCGVTGAINAFTTSGANGGPAEWWTKLSVGSYTGQLWYFCLIHPGMAGYVTVDASTRTLPAAETTQALSQYSADTSEASGAESAANTSRTTTNSNGTHTVNATSGTGTAH